MLRLAPEGCFGIDVEGMLAATTTAVCYGRDLAWIGMVLTHPDHRGQGLARRLMEHALAYLEAAQVDQAGRDGHGPSAIRKLGFEDECRVERWARAGDSAVFRQHGAPPLPIDLQAIDREAFGADRRELLSILAPIGCIVGRHSYAMARPGSKAAYFGPCVWGSPAEVTSLLDGFLGRHADQTIYWDLLPDNSEAVRIASERGFQPLRSLVRMAISGPAGFAHEDSRIYAIAGLEFG